MPYKDPVKQKEKAKEYYDKNKEKLKEKQQEYHAKNKEKIKEQKKEYYEKNKEKRKEYLADNKEKIKEKRKENSKEYYENNKEKIKENQRENNAKRKIHAVDSITSGEIIDQHKWDMWYNEIKRTNNKHPYPDDFTSDIMFEMMTKGCFYCGDIATTIDRIDSKLDHTMINCVGSCFGCNMSKGVADPATFIKKAYYRVCGEYVDDDQDIWLINKQKPRICHYTRNANKKGVSFELTKEDFDILVKDDCAYCKRSPISWFGVDRVIPSKGYVLDNVVSCCYDCNLDKLEDDVDMTHARNKRIVDRVITGELVIPRCEKVILRNGSQKTI